MIDSGQPTPGASEQGDSVYHHANGPDAMLDAVLTQVRFLLLDHRPADAAAVAVDGLQRFPTSVPLLEELAIAQRLLGNYPAAIDAAKVALSLDPRALMAQVVLADNYSLAGDHARALAAADAAIELAPDFAYTHYQRAIVRNRSVSYWAAWARGRRTRKKLRLALIDVDHAIELDPTDARFHTLRGEIEGRRESDSAAHASFATALELEPGNPTALAGLGEMDVRLRNFDAAHQEVSLAAAINPSSQPTQRRARELVRMRVMLPLWVATLTPSAAFVAWLLIGHPSPIITAIGVGGTLVSIGFVVWWWRRRLNPFERHRLLHGDARRVLVIAIVLWMLLTLAGLLLMNSPPTIELWNPSRAAPADDPTMGGVDLVAMFSLALAGAGVIGFVFWRLQSKYYLAASRGGDRINSWFDKRAGRN